MASSKVRLAVLRRKMSKSGNEYFSGWLPTCDLLLFRSQQDDDQYGEAWVLLVAERDNQPKQLRRQQTGSLNLEVAGAKSATRKQRQKARDDAPFYDDPLPDSMR